MEFLHPAMWHDHDIDFARWLHPAICMWLWNRDSEFTKWLHPAMWYVALGWHATEFAQTSAILEFYTWFLFRFHHRSRHVILHQFPKLYPNRTTLGRKNDVMSIFKMRISAILDFMDPIMGSLKSPCTTSYRSSIDTIALNCLVFEKIAFFCILATDRRTDGHARRMKHVASGGLIIHYWLH